MHLWTPFLFSAPVSVQLTVQAALPPAHLVPLSSSVGVKKNKKKRERVVELADSSSPVTQGSAASMLLERSPSPASGSRGRTVSANFGENFYDESTQDEFVQASTRNQRSSRSESWSPKSVGVAISVFHVFACNIFIHMYVCLSY